MTMTPNRIKVVVAVLTVLSVLGGWLATHQSSPASTGTAALQAADRFAADYTNPGGIDSNNRISGGYDTTPALTAAIVQAIQGGRGAGFTVTGPAVPANHDGHNTVIPTTAGPWYLQVVNVNGRWLVAAA